MIYVQTFSEAGGHATNEDSFVVTAHTIDPDCRLCFVADGQGGRPGGAQAASLACQTAMDAALLRKPRDLLKRNVWRLILGEADRVVSLDSVAGFTTLVGFCISGGVLAGASNGDCALLAMSEGGVPNELTAGQFKNPPVGSSQARFIEFSCRLIEDWLVLAMSDGVWRYTGWEKLLQVTSKIRTTAVVEQFEAACRLPGSGQFQDDFTIVAFESRR